MDAMDKVVKRAKEKISEKAGELGDDLLDILKSEGKEMAERKIYAYLRKNDSKTEEKEVGQHLRPGNGKKGTDGARLEVHENMGKEAYARGHDVSTVGHDEKATRENIRRQELEDERLDKQLKLGVAKGSMNHESLLEIENEITSVVSIANPMIGRILEAQIQVIRFIREPMLAPSITDTMMQNLEMSLRHASTREEQKWLKEQSSLIIQHLLFLMHASLVFEINGNRDEGIRLLQEAGSMIGKTIVEVLAFGGANIPANIAIRLVAAITEDNNKQSFWSQIVGFLNKKEKLKRKKKEFMLMVERTLFKIARRKSLLGKSIILSEMIYNYADYIDDHKKELAKADCKSKSKVAAMLMVLVILLPAIFWALLGALHLIVLVTSELFGSTLYLTTEGWLMSSFDVLKWLVAAGLGIGSAIMVFVRIKWKASSMKLKRQLITIARELDPSQ